MEYNLVIKNDISQISRLAPFVEEAGEQLGLSALIIMNLNLVLEEAVSNVILYAFPMKMEEDIYIGICSVQNTLIVTIADRGIEFDPTTQPIAETNLSAEERPVGGLGILIIKNIMNEVTYQRIDEMNILTMKKHI